MSDGPGDGGGSGGRRLKVKRLVDEYDLQGLGSDLERRYTSEDDARSSLRDLVDHVNREILRTALEETETDLLPCEAANHYRLLTGEDVTSGQRTEVRARLEQAGVDVDALECDFVTYQAVRSYLQRIRGIDYEGPLTRTPSRDLDSVGRLRGRTAAVTESKLEQLRESGTVTLGRFRAIVDVIVVCEDCDRQFDVDDLVERGGCDCDQR